MMKIKEGFLLREIAGKTVVLSCRADLDLNMMITLNQTGKFLWERLETGCEPEQLISDLLGKYDVDEVTAKESVTRFIEKLEKNGFIEK